MCTAPCGGPPAMGPDSSVPVTAPVQAQSLAPPGELPAMPSVTFTPRPINAATKAEMGDATEVAKAKLGKEMGGYKFKLLENKTMGQFFLQSSFRKTFWKSESPIPVTTEKLTKAQADNFKAFAKNPPSGKTMKNVPPLTALNILNFTQAYYGAQVQAEQRAKGYAP